MSMPAPPKLELNDFQRVYFKFLRDRLPEVESDDKLAQLIMSKGLFALMKEQTDQKAAPTEKRAMAPKPLPENYRIILETDELMALEQIYEVQPWCREPVEVLHLAIREGLKAMNRARASKRDPTEPTRSEMEVSREQDAARLQRAATKSPVLALLKKLEAGDALSLKFPKTLTVELTPEQQDAMQLIADREPHPLGDAQLVSRVISLGIESMKGDSHVQPLATNARTKRARHKEREKDVSLEDRLRKKLTKFLTDHPDAMSKQDARALLADLGLPRRAALR